MPADGEAQTWRLRWTEEIAARALPEVERLVAVSSPSGDAAAGEQAVQATIELLPAGVEVERIPCSSPDHADDLVVRIRGEGHKRLLLVGHLDTVVPHASHRPAVRDGNRLYGSGTLDMKGGVVLSLGVLRALQELPGAYAEVALLLVNDEEWRTRPFAHGPRFEGFDACLCFEGGELGDRGEELVVVRRKAAAAIRVTALGVAAHAGANPDAGRNALLALARVASDLAQRHDPSGEEALSVVPTMIDAGEGINVVPAGGQLLIDMRAAGEASFEAPIESIPAELDGVELTAERLRIWPGMDMVDAAAEPLERASAILGRTVAGTSRGGASDASNLAPYVPLAIDGLGPLGAHAHAPDEHLLVDSLRSRAEVALAVAAAVLD